MTSPWGTEFFDRMNEDDGRSHCPPLDIFRAESSGRCLEAPERVGAETRVPERRRVSPWCAHGRSATRAPITRIGAAVRPVLHVLTRDLYATDGVTR